jgi:hypothetical protein
VIMSCFTVFRLLLEANRYLYYIISELGSTSKLRLLTIQPMHVFDHRLGSSYLSSKNESSSEIISSHRSPQKNHFVSHPVIVSIVKIAHSFSSKNSFVKISFRGQLHFIQPHCVIDVYCQLCVFNRCMDKEWYRIRTLVPFLC